MEQIILTQTTKDALIEEITNNVLSGIGAILEEKLNKILNSSREKDLNSKEWLTSKETESLLKISSVTLWSWSKNGILKSHKIGSRLRYRKDEVLIALNKKNQ